MTKKSWGFAIATCLGFLACGTQDTPKTVVSVPTSSPCEGVDTPIGKAKLLVAEGKLRRAQTILGDAPAACAEEAAQVRASIVHLYETGPADRAGAESLMNKAIAMRAKDPAGARRDLDIARTVLERELALKTEVFSSPTATVADIRDKWMVLDGAMFEVDTGRMVIIPTGQVTLAGDNVIVASKNENDETTLSIVDLVHGDLLDTAKLYDPNFVTFDGNHAVAYESPENTLVLYDLEKKARDVVTTGRPLNRDWVKGAYAGDDRALWSKGSQLGFITGGAGGDTLHIRERRGGEVTVTRGGASIASAKIEDNRIAVGWGDAKIDVFDRAGKKIFGFDKSPAEAIGVKGDIVAWTDNSTVRTRDKIGRTGSAPIAESGCSAPRNFQITSVDKIRTQAESGDITCETVYDLRAHTSEDQGGENPGTYMQAMAQDAELCEKVGGNHCDQDNGQPVLVHHDKEAMVTTSKGALIVDESGKVLSTFEKDCVDGSMWFDKTRFACVIQNRVEVFSRSTGASLVKGPVPGARAMAGAPPYDTVDRARDALRCKIGVRLYPLDLCEDVAAEAGFIPRT